MSKSTQSNGEPKMTNSRWKPYSEIPKEGCFLVWAPDRPERYGRSVKPYVSGNTAICKRRLNAQGHVMTTIGGNFHFDVPTPELYTELDDLLAQLPIIEDGQ